MKKLFARLKLLIGLFALSTFVFTFVVRPVYAFSWYFYHDFPEVNHNNYWFGNIVFGGTLLFLLGSYVFWVSIFDVFDIETWKDAKL